MDVIKEDELFKVLGAKSAECFKKVEEGDCAGVKLALRALGLNVGVNDSGETLLHKAVRCRNVEMARMLIELGFSVFAESRGGISSVQLALSSEDPELIALFKLERSTALMFNAVLFDDLSDFRFNLENGAQLDRLFKFKPFIGAYLLHYLAYYDRAALVSCLLESCDVELDIRNLVMREAPLHLAAQYGNLRVVRLLIKAGADINCLDASGWTPLHRALLGSSFEVLKYLLTQEAKVNVRDSMGETPLHLAIRCGHYHVIPELMNAGAGYEIENFRGETPALLATVRGIKFMSR